MGGGASFIHSPRETRAACLTRVGFTTCVAKQSTRKRESAVNDPQLHRFLVTRHNATMWGAAVQEAVYAHKREIDCSTGLWRLRRWDTGGESHPVVEIPIRDLIACVCLDDLDDANPDAFMTENVPPF